MHTHTLSKKMKELKHTQKKKKKRLQISDV